MGRKRHPDRRLAIELARDYGWTPAETAQTFGLNRGNVARWFAEDGLEAPRRPGEQPEHVRKREYAKVLRLRRRGLTFREISEHTVYSIAMCRKIVKRYAPELMARRR